MRLPLSVFIVTADLFVRLFLSLAISHQAYTHRPVNDLSTAVKVTNHDQLLHFWANGGGGGGGGVTTKGFTDHLF